MNPEKGITGLTPSGSSPTDKRGLDGLSRRPRADLYTALSDLLDWAENIEGDGRLRRTEAINGARSALGLAPHSDDREYHIYRCPLCKEQADHLTQRVCLYCGHYVGRMERVSVDVTVPDPSSTGSSSGDEPETEGPLNQSGDR